MSMFACLPLLLYLQVGMSRSRLCHTLCPLWVCAYRSLGPLAFMVTTIPTMACLDVTTCETHPRVADLLDAYPFSAPSDVVCHACFVPPVWLSMLLCFPFAHLPTCSCMSLCLLVLSIFQSKGTMDSRSKPTFFLLGHPLLLDNMLVFSFICLACFVCPCLVLYVLCLLPLSLCSFLCLSTSLFPCLLHIHTQSKDTWSTSTTS